MKKMVLSTLEEFPPSRKNASTRVVNSSVCTELEVPLLQLDSGERVFAVVEVRIHSLVHLRQSDVALTAIALESAKQHLQRLMKDGLI